MLETSNRNVGEVRAAGTNQPQFSIDPTIIQVVSYGGALGALLMLLLIIRAITNFVKEVKKDD
jgi:O-antigen ligase